MTEKHYITLEIRGSDTMPGSFELLDRNGNYLNTISFSQHDTAAVVAEAGVTDGNPSYLSGFPMRDVVQLKRAGFNAEEILDLLKGLP